MCMAKPSKYVHKMCKYIENIAMASTGHAEIIINEGGLLAIESTQVFEANFRTQILHLLLKLALTLCFPWVR